MDVFRTDLDGLSPDEVIDLAKAYLDLMNMMARALEECDTGWGFFTVTDHDSFLITGHPPRELVARIRSG